MAGGRQRGTTAIAWLAWTVHAYTASGALLAFLATLAIFAGRFRAAFLWLFTAVVLVVPAGILFHPPFVYNVVLPFLEAIGA